MTKFLALVALGLMTLTACSKPIQKVETVYTIDQMMAQADSLVDDTLVFEGICSHLCKHGGRKAFLMGSDESQIFRVEGAQAGNFAPECVNNIVRVRGILRSLEYVPETNRIGDGLAHGENGQGCETEQKAIRIYYGEALSYEIVTR